MRSKKRILKKRKIFIAICILLLILLGTLICFGSKNKKIETSAQPMEEEEFVAENLNEENINNIDESPENTIDENIENNVTNEKNNTNNSSNASTKNNTMPYYIKVNYGAQVVTIYKKDANGDYTVPVKAMICSTGTATPKSGVYSIPGRWTWGALFGKTPGEYVYSPYCVKITGNILFHSVPYIRKGDNASLEYWEYDNLGKAASAGCIRLKMEDLIWLYNNCANGTKVEFYSSSDPGPKGKPSAKKISSYPDYLRNWDPTDPNPNNPWKNYKETEITNTNDKQNETTNNTKPDESAKKEETNGAKNNGSEKGEETDSAKPDNTGKNETTDNTKPDNSVKNEITNSTKPDNSGKNEQTNTLTQNNINENQNNVVRNETQNQKTEVNSVVNNK